MDLELSFSPVFIPFGFSALTLTSCLFSFVCLLGSFL